MTTQNQLLLPKSTWAGLLSALLQKRTVKDYQFADDDLAVLRQLGYVKSDHSLTDVGIELCNLMHVRSDTEAASAINHDAVVSLPVTQALLQSLAGLDPITVEQARMSLIFTGADEKTVDSRLTNLLMILNENDVIKYNRKGRTIKLLVSAKRTSAPAHVYIDRTRPYSNDLRIREILRECHGSILWLDKYFQKEAFEWIFREATAENISSVRIISTVDDSGLDQLAIADYKRLKKELANKNISLEWRTFARSDAHDLHDRWVLDDENLCYNTPSIGSIKSGQRSELHRSPNHNDIKQIFEQYYQQSRPVM